VLGTLMGPVLFAGDLIGLTDLEDPGVRAEKPLEAAGDRRSSTRPTWSPG
jgi:hypothetical protein